MRTLVNVLAFAVVLAVTVALFTVAFARATVLGAVAATAAARRLTPSAPAERLHPDPAHSEDPAPRRLPTGPVLHDLRRMAGEAVRAAHDRLVALPDPKSPDSLFARLLQRRPVIGETDLVLVLPSAGLVGGFIAGYATVVVLVAIVAAAHAVRVGLVVLTVLATASALRCFEIAALALRGISIECGTCHQRLFRPVFVCGCGQAHHCLVPDARGVFRRTCHCGSRLPTLLITGKRTMRARCGLCGATLPSPVQSVPAVHIPVVGGAAAGKSVFTHTAIGRPRSDDDRHHDFTPADDTTAQRLAHAHDLLHTNTLPPTPVGQPIAYTVHTRYRRRRRLAHLYDAAGEIFERADHLAVSTFLALADGVILVVDPFSVPAVSARAGPQARTAACPSPTDPKLVLDGLVETLRETHRAALALPLAVVITKADALASLPAVPHPYTGVAADPITRSTAARQWLLDHDRIDLVNSVHNHFRRVRYFVVSCRDAEHARPDRSSRGEVSVVHDDPASPILWLLDR
jgi:hypothetical protein